MEDSGSWREARRLDGGVALGCSHPRVGADGMDDTDMSEGTEWQPRIRKGHSLGHFCHHDKQKELKGERIYFSSQLRCLVHPGRLRQQELQQLVTSCSQSGRREQ